MMIKFFLLVAVAILYLSNVVLANICDENDPHCANFIEDKDIYSEDEPHPEFSSSKHNTLIKRTQGTREITISVGENSLHVMNDDHYITSIYARDGEALMRKNFLLRYRHLCQTVFELMFPLFLIFTLVYGYSLSDITVVPKGDYLSTTFINNVVRITNGSFDIAPVTFDTGVPGFNILYSDEICLNTTTALGAIKANSLANTLDSYSALNLLCKSNAFSLIPASPYSAVPPVLCDLLINATDPKYDPAAFENLLCHTTILEPLLPPNLNVEQVLCQSNGISNLNVSQAINIACNSTLSSYAPQIGTICHNITEMIKAYNIDTSESIGTLKEQICALAPFDPAVLDNVCWILGNITSVYPVKFVEGLAKQYLTPAFLRNITIVRLLDIFNRNNTLIPTNLGACLNVTSLQDYYGPTPVPSFDVYLGASLLLRQLLGNNNSTYMIEKLLYETDFATLFRLGKLSFAPRNPSSIGEVNNFVSYCKNNSLFFNNIFSQVYASEQDALSAAEQDSYQGDNAWAVVIFDSLDSITGDLNYTIRMNYTEVPTTRRTVIKLARGLKTNYREYYTSGFLSIALLIEDYQRHLISKIIGLNSTLPSITGVPMPTAAFSSNDFYTQANGLMGFIMTLAVLLPVIRMIKGMVEEKESKMKETLKIMGLKSLPYALSWVALYVIVFSIICILTVTVIKLTLFNKSNYFLMLLAFGMFYLTLIGICFCFASMIENSKIAGIIAPLVLLAMVLPRYIFFNSNDDEQLGLKILASFLSPTAFAFCCDIISDLEEFGEGVQFSNAGSADGYTFATALSMLLVDALFYPLVALFINFGWPRIKRLAIFTYYECLNSTPASRERRLSSIHKSLINHRNSSSAPATPIGLHMSSVKPTNAIAVNPSADYVQTASERELSEVSLEFDVEKVPAELGLTLAVVVNNLRKVYDNGKEAIKGVSLQMYYNQITCLLGHNGAGKSSVISVLTGLYQATSGNAIISGFDTNTQMDLIRNNIGVCPQGNVLFDSLTVLEHMQMLAVIKGIPPSDVDEKAKQMILEVGLNEKMNTLSSALSGGQKRKLCVGMALLGNSKICFLDEPTSGMDPHSRRTLWELLKTSKKNRCIVLTTHYMDEADLLGDRIAIMSQGKLRCMGTSLFLKNKFGIGYRLTVAKSNEKDADVRMLIKKMVPSSLILNFNKSEITFQLPLTSVNIFPDLFKNIDDNQKQLGIDYYAISSTTLEEVFLKLAHNNQDKSIPLSTAIVQEVKFVPEASISTVNNPISADGWNKTYEPAGTFVQFKQLMRKRYLNSKRDFRGFACQILLPVVVVALVLLILTIQYNFTGASMHLDISLYSGINAAGAKPSSSSTVQSHTAIVPFLSNAQSSQAAKCIASQFGPTVVNMVNSQAKNASELNNYLASTYFIPSSTRVAAYGLNDSSYPFIAFHNSSDPHALPSIISSINSAYLCELFSSISKPPPISVMNNYPLPLTGRQVQITQGVLNVLASVFLLIPFCFVSSNFVVFVVKEKVCQAKHLQITSGVNLFSFWASNMLFDILSYLVVVSVTMIVFCAYGSEAFVGSAEKAFATFLMLLLFGVSTLAMSYCLSFRFNSPGTAQIMIGIINFVLGFALVLGNFILDNLPKTKDTNKQLKSIYRLFPQFNFGEGLISLSLTNLVDNFQGGKTSSFQWDITGRPITYMALEALFFCCLTLIIDLEIFQKLFGFAKDFCFGRKKNTFINHNGEGELMDKAQEYFNINSDDDIVKEKKRALEEDERTTDDAVLIKDLLKVYPSRSNDKAKVAVNHLSFGIQKGEIFGFLGVNGAGKSTTINILVSHTTATSGDAYIKGKSVTNEFDQIRRYIGFTPQFDPLFDKMTGREHLEFYGTLKGLPSSLLPEAVNMLLELVGLSQFSDYTSETYSGGNKRKLSLAMALIGKPEVLFLDEPSSGMDPESRRGMWDVISSSVSGKSSAILTTHSMEEAEALCSRIGIIDKGNLVALGSLAHLKNKFGNGYEVEMTTFSSSFDTITSLLREVFHQVTIIEEFTGRIRYKVNSPDLKLSTVFGHLEQAKMKLGIKEYSVSQSSLENIFLSLARAANNE